MHLPTGVLLLSWYVFFRKGSQGKSYTLCPYCFNHPPFKDMRKGSGCNSCTHPACLHSRSTLGVASCVSCENGVLVLDMTSAPKWKLACNDNRCSTVVSLFQDAHKVRACIESRQTSPFVFARECKLVFLCFGNNNPFV